MLLRIGFEGIFEDYQGYPLSSTPLNLTADVLINDNYEIEHSETGTSLFFKEISVPVYNIQETVTNDDGTTTTTIYPHTWDTVDGIFLKPEETYNYNMGLSEIDFTINEPTNPNIFDKYINSTTGQSNITNINVIENNVYEWQGNQWINISNNPNDFKYTSTYQYTSIGTNIQDIIPDFYYPGRQDFNSDDMKSNLTTDQLNDIINEYTNMGYTDQVDFLNGTKDSPFQPAIYNLNPIKLEYIDNDYRGSTDHQKDGLYPDNTMNHPDNPHLESFTTAKYLLSDSTYSYSQSLQHTYHDRILSELEPLFLKAFIKQESVYYMNQNIEIYNQLNT